MRSKDRVVARIALSTLIAGLLIVANAPAAFAAGSLSGPAFGPAVPGSPVATSSNPSPTAHGRAGGQTWTFTWGSANFTHLYWGPDVTTTFPSTPGPGSPASALDGALDNAPGTERPMNPISVSGNTAVWTGLTRMRVFQSGSFSFVNQDTRFTLKTFQADGVTPLNLTTPAAVNSSLGLTTPLPTAIGALVPVPLSGGQPASFKANFIFEARRAGTSDAFQPLYTYYDNSPTDPAQSSQAIASFGAGFYWNRQPVANPQSLNTDANQPLPITLTGSDPDGKPVTYDIASQPANGTLSGTAPNVTYTPSLGFHGTDSFTFTTSNGLAVSAAATITIGIINHAPTASDDSVSTLSDAPVAINLIASDPDGDPLTYSIGTSPVNGSLSGTEPNLTYTPNFHYRGPDLLTFTVSDGDLTSNIATVLIEVLNRAPVADAQAVSTLSDEALDITLTGSDAEDDAITYSIVDGPSNGTLTGTAPAVTYTPNLHFHGADSFTFKVNDGTVDSLVATVSITVVNRPPIADNQTVSTLSDQAAAITLTASDPEEDSLVYIVDAPSHGSLVDENGDPIIGPIPGTQVTYVPDFHYHGPDSFTFKVNDGENDSNIATVSITVVNRAPVAIDQSVETLSDQPVDIVLAGTDPELDPLTFAVVDGPAHGTLTGTAPNLTYTPDTSYHGPDSFTFTANDGENDSPAATVSIIVGNRPPAADDQSVETLSDESLAVILTATDPESDPLTYSIVAQPEHGTLLGVPPAVTYVPDLHYHGPDSFTFKANDGENDSNTATISITVINRPPVADDQTVTTEIIPTVITLTAADPEEDALTFQVIDGPTHGVLSGTAPNLSYVPDQRYHGQDSFTFTVNDGESESNLATVTIDVVNHAPAAPDHEAQTPQYTPVTVDVLEGTSDLDGDDIFLESATNGAHGTTTVNAVDGTVTYNPGPTFKGSDSFTYTIRDDFGGVTTAAVTILEIGCGEDGIQALDGTPAEGTASETVDQTVEPAVGSVDRDTAATLHATNCGVVVPTEDAIDETLP